MRPTRALLAVLAAAALLSPTTAAAGIIEDTSPACPAGKPQALSIVAPAQLPFNRTHGVYLSRASGTLDSEIFGGSIVIAPADPARPISTPYSGFASIYSQYETFRFSTRELRLAPNDGPASITATWFEQEPRFSKQWCRMTASTIVTGKVGVQPKLIVSKSQTSGLGLKVVYSAIPSCNDAAGEPITLTVKTTTQTGSYSWNDACGLEKDPSVSKLSNGVISKSGTTDGRRFAIGDDGSGPVAGVTAYPQGRSVRRIDWTVTSGPTTLGSGKYWVQSYPAWSNRIWEEEDSFVNVCLDSDGNYEIRKENGRLYCDMEDDPGVTYFFKKKPKKFKAW